jgi:hypothetical protein
MRLRFSIRDLLFVTAIVALAVGWWLDHKEQVSRYQALIGPTKFEVYPITTANPDVLLKVLQSMLAGTSVRLAVDIKSNFLVAQATPAQHATIRALVDKLERASSPSAFSSTLDLTRPTWRVDESELRQDFDQIKKNWKESRVDP